MEKHTNKCNGASATLVSNFGWFDNDTPLAKGFDEFCKGWWVNKEKQNVGDGGWSNYKPYEEWKLMELEKQKPKHDEYGGIREYGLMVNADDFGWMCDYLLSKTYPSLRIMKDP
ncbi:hypothetical protein Tco_0109758 [Tanacetum coccineum]